MRLNDYILSLQQIEKEHGGNLAVESYFVYDRVSARQPQIAYRKILKGRESKACFWDSYKTQDSKGEKVVKV